MKKSVLIISLIIAIMVSAYFAASYLDYKKAQGLCEESAVKYGGIYGVEPELVLSVIYAESNFNFKAESKKGAAGVMQIMPSTAEYICSRLKEEYQAENLYDYDKNIKYGTYYLGYLLGIFPAVETAVAAYNAGEGTVREWLKAYSSDGATLDSIPYKETKNYTEKVMNRYSKLKT